MKVIGAGFARTGTSSLKEALEVLGYHPCYHMTAVMRGYRRGEVRLWDEYMTGRRVTMDWHRLFKNYEATVDMPTCIYYQELMKAFPAAKVILTIRDPEKWWDSFERIIKLGSLTRFFYIIHPMFKHFGNMNDHMLELVFGGPLDKGRYIERYLQHNDEVKATVPTDRLLVYSVTEGWEPLCEFLGCSMPTKPFPYLNVKSARVKKDTLEMFWRESPLQFFARFTNVLKNIFKLSKNK